MNTKVTKTPLICFVLDETGSMDKNKPQVIAGFDFFRNEQRSNTQNSLMSLTKFNSRNVSTPFDFLPITMVPSLSVIGFNPNHGTNLFDTVINRINELSEYVVHNLLFVCMTDGEDNRSRYNANDVKQLVKEFKNWSFVYLGSNQNANDIGLRMGFPKGNIKSFVDAKFQDTMEILSRQTSVFVNTVSVATTNFFGE